MNTVKTTLETETSNCLAGFHALSDPLRVHVIERLRTQEMCVCDLCGELDVSQSKLSFHLRVLKDAGLVRARPQGRWTYYSLNLPQFVVLEQYLSDYRRYSPIIPTRLCDDGE
ncbi:metalloregulator ArsR/SmtB family transcription factor [Oscillatoria sp. CS-180]|uniref:ArsR/SmtB family transcription factor n=1 Tax=Oscillatoria sp. CS-180 TaxID=3021720 RepID=UPI00232DD7B5|nr:metalloregulator ArsR/SmtB family transcription factor [Oscillatoria sp. CS-180]MDB9524692.1 metalloregulator ArsR/SmtB family transcription factor [Oscillatoria sp. CS-180]